MPTEVKEYKCDYCGKRGFYDIKEAEDHEKNCFMSPDHAWFPCPECKGSGYAYGYTTCDCCGGVGGTWRRKDQNE